MDKFWIIAAFVVVTLGVWAVGMVKIGQVRSFASDLIALARPTDYKAKHRG